MIQDHIYSLDYPGKPYSLRVVKDFVRNSKNFLVIRYTKSPEHASSSLDWEERSMALCRRADEPLTWVPLIDGFPSRFLPVGFRYHGVTRENAHEVALDLQKTINDSRDESEIWWTENFPGYMAVLTGEGEKCEGCISAATTADSEGVPLCEDCYDGLVAESQ